MKNLTIAIHAIIAALVLTATASAQNIVKGKITNSHGAPVPFAFVSAQNDDSVKQSVAQKIADSAGNYQLEIKNKGNYLLQVSSVGYSETQKKFTVNADETLMNIALETGDVNLKGVTVTAKIPLIVNKIDRMVMNVDNNPLTTGKSAQEAIGLAPGIVIYNNQIMLNGMPVSRVMINGKMLQLQGTDLTNYLTGLRSENIKSIEIMPHPPAEYDAAGSGGLINIILKKNIKSGLNGSVYANYIQGKYAGTSDGAQLNFKKRKVGLFANYSLYKVKNFQYINQNRNMQPDGTYTADDSSTTNVESHNVRAGITYDITGKQYLAVEYNGNFLKTGQNFRAINQITYPQNPAGNSLSTGLFPNNYAGRYNNVGLNYHLQTDSLGSTFTFLSDYTNNYMRITNSVTSATTVGGTSVDTAYQNNTPAASKIFTAEAKYLKRFKAASSLGFGGKISSTDINNQAAFQYQSPFGSSWLNSASQNYVYDYKENIIAGYVNYQGRILKTDIQLGLRGENTHYTGKLYDTSYAENGKNYFGLFPTVFLRRNLDSAGNHNIGFNYSRRISRPGFWQLNPHVVYVDNYTIGAGNPFLQPEYDNSFELSYMLKKKYVLTLNYTHGGDVISPGMHPSPNNPEIMMQQSTNSGTLQKWMASVFVPVNIAKWWTTQEYIEYDNTHVVNPGAYDIQKDIVMLNSNMQFTIAKDFTATLHVLYFNRMIFANAVFNSMWQADMGFQKKFFKQRLTAKIAVDDIFNTNKITGTFYSNNFNLNIVQKMQSQQVTLGVTYIFDLGKAFQSHNIESSSADEKSRLK